METADAGILVFCFRNSLPDIILAHFGGDVNELFVKSGYQFQHPFCESVQIHCFFSQNE